MADLFRAEMLAEVPRERINPDAFDGLCVAMQCVELTAALRVAEILPVGGFVASAREAWLFDEGFQQYRAIGIACVPVLGQAPAGQGKDPRGEVFTVYPRQNEEARVVDDEVQVAATLCARPADDVVARFDFPGARTEAERGDYVPFGAHEVTQLCPWHQLMTQVVVALDIRVPQQRVALVAHQIDAEPSKVDSRDTAGLEHRVLDVGILPSRRAAATTLLAGRTFTWRDDKDAPKAAVVNREFAREVFGSVAQAIGGYFKNWPAHRISTPRTSPVKTNVDR